MVIRGTISELLLRCYGADGGEVSPSSLEARPMERPNSPRPSLRQVLADFGPIYAASGFIGLVFAASGPVAIILSVGTRGGLSPVELASWIFGVFFINGLITLGMSWRYRQPLCFFWTIPGTVLVGPSLQHLTFPEIIGAFYATSVLILVLGR